MPSVFFLHLRPILEKNPSRTFEVFRRSMSEVFTKTRNLKKSANLSASKDGTKSLSLFSSIQGRSPVQFLVVFASNNR